MNGEVTAAFNDYALQAQPLSKPDQFCPQGGGSVRGG
jgi:hypothetical protein